MKNKLIYFCLFAVMSIVVSSCKKDNLMSFVAQNYLSINLTKTTDQLYPQRSYTFTFEHNDVTEHTLEIPVKIAGRYSDKDRKFSVKVVDTLTTAANGVHYEILSTDQQIIKAGQSEGSLLVKLKRATDLKTSTLQIVLQIIKNDNFAPGYQPIIKILVSDRLIQPEWWDAIHKGKLGKYSELKCRLWLEFMKITDGTDPWSVAPYKIILPNETSLTINDAATKASVLGFKNWLRTEKGDPYDPTLMTSVVLSLGSY